MTQDAARALRAFVAEREWAQFHSAENLAKSISIEAGEAGHDRLVVAEGPVPVQLVQVGEDPVEVVERVRSLRMARELRDLPGLERRED